VRDVGEEVDNHLPQTVKLIDYRISLRLEGLVNVESR